jgi:signal transduction histidine kinase
VYKKGVNSINSILLVAIVISFQSLKFTTVAVGGIVLYLAFYILSTVIAYERQNIPFIVAIQILVYCSMVYLKVGCFTFLILFKLIISYGVFNYLYIRKYEKSSRSI